MEYKISPAAQEYLNQYLDNLEKDILESASSKDQKSIDLEDIVMSIRKNNRNKSVLFEAILKTNPNFFVFALGLLSFLLIGVAFASLYLHNEVFDLDFSASIFFIVLGVLYGISAFFLGFILKVKPTRNKYLLVKYWKTLEVYVRETARSEKIVNISQITEYLVNKTENSGISKDDIIGLLNTRNKLVHEKDENINQAEISRQISLYERIFEILDQCE